MTAIEQFLRQTVALPSLPAVLFRLNRLLEQDGSIAQISELIREDPALTSRLLRLVNSPMFRFAGEIDSISNAIRILGLRELRNLAYAVSAVRMFDGMPMERANMAQFWRHSLYCALIARALAEEAGLRSGERCFLGGLLHDVGGLLLYLQAPEQAAACMQRAADERRPQVELERELLGFDHAELGAELLRRWGLPNHVVELVACHHEAAADGADRELALVRLANQLANDIGAARTAGGFHAAVHPGSWRAAGIDMARRGAVLAKAEEQFESARRTLLS